MKELQNVNIFIEKYSTKTVFSAFKTIHGVNTNKLLKLKLIGGFDKTRVEFLRKI